MKLTSLAPRAAEGALLAHSHDVKGRRLKKGTRLGPAEIALLEEAGVGAVLVAILDTDDLHEDEAAARLAAAVLGDGLRAGEAFTGRVNLYAVADGLIRVDAGVINAINAVDEAITIATLPPLARVSAGDMVATVKIIPFAVPEGKLRQAIAAAPGAQGRPGAAALALAPFRPRRVHVIATGAVTPRALATTEGRLRRLGALAAPGVTRVAHEPGALAGALAGAIAARADLILVLPVSVTIDRGDVAPLAIERAGGRIIRLGMPVDPGNLLLLGEIAGVPLIVLPGCAKSPKENGFDWVLERLCADIPVTNRDIAAMGVGGLLKEIPVRPQPREARPSPGPPRIEGILLAAGLSRRMGHNKLLELVDGIPIVRRAATALLSAGLGRVIVVLGHDAPGVAAVLAGLPVTTVTAPDYADGMSASLKAGLRALGPEADGAVIALGDMPFISERHIAPLCDAFTSRGDAQVFIPVFRGERGHPVLFARPLFSSLLDLEGDEGARSLVRANSELVCEVEVGDDGIFVDVDTGEALAAARSRGRTP